MILSLDRKQRDKAPGVKGQEKEGAKTKTNVGVHCLILHTAHVFPDHLKHKINTVPKRAKAEVYNTVERQRESQSTSLQTAACPFSWRPLGGDRAVDLCVEDGKHLVETVSLSPPLSGWRGPGSRGGDKSAPGSRAGRGW